MNSGRTRRAVSNELVIFLERPIFRTEKSEILPQILKIFKKTLSRFAQKVHQSGLSMDSDRTRGCLFDGLFIYFWRPFVYWENSDLLPAPLKVEGGGLEWGCPKKMIRGHQPGWGCYENISLLRILWKCPILSAFFWFFWKVQKSSKIKKMQKFWMTANLPKKREIL
jgi:hypothetical protein